MTDLPAGFAEVADDFAALPAPDRLQLLVELGDELPDLPARLRDHPELLEQVVECQSPVYVRAEVEGEDAPVVRLYVSAPPQSPTTRGFAGVLHAALDGAPVGDVLDLPADAPSRLGLDGVVSPLRLRGMSGMLERVRRQVRSQLP